MRRLITTHEAAVRVGLARATLAKLRVLGGGPPFVKLGAKVVYDEAELESWSRALPRRTSTSAEGVERP